MFIVALFFIHIVNAIVEPHSPEVISDYTNCLTQLIEYNFQESGDIIFASTDNDSASLLSIKLEVLKKINAKYKYKVQIVTNSTNEELLIQCEKQYDKYVVLKSKQLEALPIINFYLIIIDNLKQFSYVLEKIICCPNWNPNARFIILLFDFSSEGEKIKEDLEKIFTRLFQNNVLKVAIIAPQVNKIRYSAVYSWNPLNPPKYCGYSNETAKNRIRVENVCDHGMVNHSRDLFNNNIPSDMKGCVLKILALEKQPFVSRNKNDPNIEIKIINEVLMHYNFKMDYNIIHNYRGEREHNGKWSGALNLLISKQGQLLLGGMFPDHDVQEDFECSTTYYLDSYTWVVPRASIKPPWYALIIIFNKSLWCVFIGAFVLSIVTWRVLGKLSNDSAYHQDLNHCFLNALITAVGFSNYAHPSTNSLRIFCVFFNIHCLLFFTAYQSKLTTVLRSRSFEYQIQTTKELVASGLKFGGLEELHNLFVNSSDAVDRDIGERWINAGDLSKALKDVTVHRNFSVLCSRMELAHMSRIMPELKDRLQHDTFYAFKNNMFTAPIVSIALKGFPFMSRFSKTLNHFKQNGVNVAIRRQMSTIHMRQLAKLKKKNKTGSGLTVNHLQGGFLILLVGHISGIVILCLENFIDAYQSSFVDNKRL